MKQASKRLLSMLLAMVMILTMLPTAVFAESPEMTLRAPDMEAVAGSTVVVKLELEDNPGLAAMKVKVAFDDILTLTGVEFNDDMGGQYQMPQTMNSPVTLAWFNGTENFTDESATFATLTFQVSEEASVGDVAELIITHTTGDIYDITETDITLNVVNGSVTIANVVPGDINGDGIANMKDLTRLFQYLADWDVEVNELALDTNGDGSVNMKDQTRLLQYHADWDVPLYPIVNDVCEHELTEVEYKASTCTEDGNNPYWYCTKCEKCFDSEEATKEYSEEEIVIAATGHTEEEYVESGYVNVKCSICGEILGESKVAYTVTYVLHDDDPYLKTLAIDNSNEEFYTSEEGLTLAPLEVAGYTFDGWVDGYGSKVSSIPVGSTGDVKLYAKWTIKAASSYTVKFMSEGYPVSVEIEEGQWATTVTKPMNEAFNLPEAEMQGHVFLCWTDNNNNIVNRVNAGSIGELTVHANWTTTRNQAQAVSELDKPIVIEDDENGQLLFVYNIGKIVNVPLQVLENYGNVLGQGLTWKKTVETSTTITDTKAVEIADTIEETTSESAAWSLSEDWNESITYDEENQIAEEIEKTNTIRDRVTAGENWNISTENGGSTSYTKKTGSSASASQTNTTGKVFAVEESEGGSSSTTESTELNIGIEGKITNTKTISANANLGAKIGAKKGNANGEVNGGIGVGASNTTTMELGGHIDYTKGWSTTNETHWDKKTSAEFTSGTEESAEVSVYTDEIAETTSTWNSQQGYAQSKEITKEGEVSAAISQAVYEKLGISSTTGHDTSKSSTEESTKSNTTSRLYSTMTEYSTETKEVVTSEITNEGAAKGWYRLLTVGDVHVFAVVGYDIATNSYYTYTYNIVDKDRREMFDYALEDDPDFNDRENGVLPFEVPYEVHEIVGDVVKKSEGLTIDEDTGIITAYNGTAEAVIIPDYISVDQGDGTTTAVKVVGIAPNVFANKTNIKAVKLSRYITTIPDGAFAGCTNLEMVVGYGLEKIGASAFNGCVNLGKFVVSKQITELGDNAFVNVPEISVTAYDTKVAMAAINSGAKKISLYLTEMNDSFGEAEENRVLTVAEGTESFELYGGRKTTLTDTVLKSHAAKTVLNGVTFDTDGAIVLELDSDEVTLVAVNVNTDAVAMHLPNETTQIYLQGTNTFTSSNVVAVVSRNAAYRIFNKSVASKLNVTGDMLVCDTFTEEEDSLVNVSGEIRVISEEEYQAVLTSNKVIFDPNGGTLNEGEESKILTMGQAYGTLPTPTREYYTFNGWFTEATGGTQITETDVFSSATPITLYAQWTLNSFVVTFDANGGSVSTTSLRGYCGQALGTLPTPTRNYYTFNGWYTATSGGTKVTSSTVYDTAKDVTLYAQWTHNPVSDWVKASAVPSGAEIVSREYRYTKTSTTESRETSLSGWTQTGSYWVESGSGDSPYSTEFPSGFDPNHWIYVNFAKEPYYAYETATEKREVGQYWAGYVYWHWMYDCGGANAYNRRPYFEYEVSPENGYVYKYFRAFDSTNNWSSVSHTGQSGWTWYEIKDSHTSFDESAGSWWWYRFNFYIRWYTDYYKMFQYQKVENNLVSASYPSGTGISNVVEWVQYRAK